jgi:methyl-accepting chemotaxis protein
MTNENQFSHIRQRQSVPGVAGTDQVPADPVPAREPASDSDDAFSPLAELCAAALPIWQRHIETADQQSRDAINNLSRQFGNLVERLNATADASRQVTQGQSITDSFHQSEQDLKQAVEGLRSTNEARAQMLEQMRELTTYTEKLQDMAQEVVDISNQTNMLALNASIEAAHAGDSARGFAVIADEVRSLSKRSREAADRMTNTMGEANTVIDRTFQSAETATRQEREQLNQSEREIHKVIGAMDDIVEQLRGSSERLEGETASIGGEIQDMVVELQFQDRVSQILSQVRNNLAHLQELIASAEGVAAPDELRQLFNTEQWLQSMEQNYAMLEQHLNHGGNEAGSSTPREEGKDEITFF